MSSYLVYDVQLNGTHLAVVASMRYFYKTTLMLPACLHTCLMLYMLLFSQRALDSCYPYLYDRGSEVYDF